MGRVKKTFISVKTIEKLQSEDKELSLNIDNLKNKILYSKENEV